MAETVVFIAGKDPLEEIGGGHSVYVRAHARAAIRAGFEPHLFCAALQADTVETDYGVVHRLRPLWPLRPRRGILFRGYLSLAVFHVPQIAANVEHFLLRRKGPHLIHSFGVWGNAGVIVRRRLLRKGVEAIPLLNSYTTLENESEARVGGVNPAHGHLRRMGLQAEHLWLQGIVTQHERQAHLGSRLVIVNYESVRRLLLAKYDLAARCRKVPYTSETAFLHEDTKAALLVPKTIAGLQPANAPLIVAVSRHDPRKGVDVLLLALARLRQSGIPFRACLIGEGSLLVGHRRLADRLGLGDTTRIEGFVPDAYQYLRHADVFTLPSLEEGSGSLSLIEALQAGVAIVASNVDGIPEDVVDEESALLVKPGDPGDLASAITRVLTDPALRQALARNARKTFLERFSPKVFSETLRQTYAEFGFAGSPR